MPRFIKRVSNVRLDTDFGLKVTARHARLKGSNTDLLRELTLSDFFFFREFIQKSTAHCMTNYKGVEHLPTTTNCRRIVLSLFDHFVMQALKGLKYGTEKIPMQTVFGHY